MEPFVRRHRKGGQRGCPLRAVPRTHLPACQAAARLQALPVRQARERRTNGVHQLRPRRAARPPGRAREVPAR